MEDRRHIADLPAIVKARALAGRFTDIVGYTPLMGLDEDRVRDEILNDHL